MLGRVLIVDDSPTSRDVQAKMRAACSEIGFMTITVSTESFTKACGACTLVPVPGKNRFCLCGLMSMTEAITPPAIERMSAPSRRATIRLTARRVRSQRAQAAASPIL